MISAKEAQESLLSDEKQLAGWFNTIDREIRSAMLYRKETTMQVSLPRHLLLRVVDELKSKGFKTRTEPMKKPAHDLEYAPYFLIINWENAGDVQGILGNDKGYPTK